MIDPISYDVFPQNQDRAVVQVQASDVTAQQQDVDPTGQEETEEEAEEAEGTQQTAETPEYLTYFKERVLIHPKKMFVN